MHTIKVPQTIQVGGHIYSITHKTILADENLHGDANHHTLTIGINPTRPPSQKLEALIHEWLHIIDHIYIPDELPETTIRGLSEGLTQILTGLGIQLDWSAIPTIQLKEV